MVVEVTDRIFTAMNKDKTKEKYFCAVSKSFLISADMAHAIQSKFVEKH